jgi:acyl-CoA dehydrogenase
MGVCQDTILPMAYANVRTLRLADGPDEVRARVCARAGVRVCVRAFARA